MRYAILCLLAACSSAPERPATTSRPEQRATSELTPAARMELARRIHQPAAGHEKLAALAGEWQVTLSSQLADGSQSSLLGTGRAQITWVMEGRFLDWHLELLVDGQPHLVRGYLGYDVLLQEYQALWISELTTSMSLARGSGDPESRGIVLQVRPSKAGEVAGPRSVLRLLDRDHFVIESIAPDGRGVEGVIQRTSYVRLKP